MTVTCPLRGGAGCVLIRIIVLVTNGNYTHGRAQTTEIMQQLNYSLPIAAEFTDYSRWERRPSNKSGTSAGWSVGKVARGRTSGSKRQQVRRRDALPPATGLSQASISGSRTLDNAQHSQQLHSHCHGRIKKVSSSGSSPRPVSVRRSTGSCDRKISKAQVVLSPQCTLLQVSPCN